MFIEYLKNQWQNKKNMWLPSRHVFLDKAKPDAEAAAVATVENVPVWSSVEEDKAILELVNNEKLRMARYYLSKNLDIEQERLKTRLAITDATAEKMKKKHPGTPLSKIILDQEVNAELSRIIKLEHKKKPFWTRLKHTLTGKKPQTDRDKIEAEKYAELFSHEIYGPGRLSVFLADLKQNHKDVYRTLNEQYGIDVDNLKDNTGAQMLLAKLLFIYDDKGGGTNIKPVEDALKGMQTQLPEKKASFQSDAQPNFARYIYR